MRELTQTHKDIGLEIITAWMVTPLYLVGVGSMIWQGDWGMVFPTILAAPLFLFPIAILIFRFWTPRQVATAVVRATIVPATRVAISAYNARRELPAAQPRVVEATPVRQKALR